MILPVCAACSVEMRCAKNSVSVRTCIGKRLQIIRTMLHRACEFIANDEAVDPDEQVGSDELEDALAEVSSAEERLKALLADVRNSEEQS